MTLAAPAPALASVSTSNPALAFAAASTVCMRYASPLGELVLAATDRHVVGLWFEGQKHPASAASWPEAPQHALLQQACAQLGQYFAGQRRSFNLPIDFSAGSPFQQSVWRALCTIAPGSTCSYQDLAQAVGRPRAARAVGAAVGRNPLALIVPCHRVVGSHGALTGYAGGLHRKQALLKLENALG